MSKQKQPDTMNMEKRTGSTKTGSTSPGKQPANKGGLGKLMNINFNFLRKGNIKTKVITGFSIVAGALVIMGMISLGSIYSMNSQFSFVVEHDAPVIENARELAKLVVDMETGQRGFIITGREEFLDPYNQGIEDFEALIQKEIVLVSDNPAQVERLHAIQASVNEWLEKAARPEIAMARNVHASTVSEDYLQDLLGAGEGKGILDNLRAVFDEFTINFKAIGNKQGELVVSHLAKDMVDRETGQRGFLITGEEEFLQPYVNGERNFNDHMLQLRTLVRNNAINLALADRVQLLANEWKEKAAGPEIAARREMNENPETMQDMSRVLQSGTGKSILDKLRGQFREFTDVELQLTAERYGNASSTSSFAIISTVLIILLGTIIAMLIGVGLANTIATPIALLKESATAIASGDLEAEIDVESQDEVGELAVAMITMRDNIYSVNKSNEDQNWLLVGTNIIAEQVKGEKQLSELANALISNITPHLNGQMGAFYISNANDELKLTATYAYDKRNQSSNTVKVGEGLVGQAAAEKKSIIFRDVPADYFNINSGLGKATPRNVIVFPALFQNQVSGVIEIGTAHDFTDLHLEFVKNATEAIGIAINTAQAREEVNHLLSETQRQAEELQASEEELKSQQEELQQTNEELEEQTQQLQTSEEELKTQQEELLQSNQELEEKGQLLEERSKAVIEKNDALEVARLDLKEKADQLELTGKYKSEFLANMSHELRTPLNSIMLLSKLLSENSDNLTKEQLEYAGVIHGSGQGLLELINEILDLSKIESGKMKIEIQEVEIAQVNKTMVDTFSPLTQKKKITFRVDVDPKVPKTIRTDRLRLEQLLKNLLSNAVKFTPEKGKIHLSVIRPGKSVKYQDAALHDRSVIAFAVSDTGIGIPKDKLDLVFEAFQQADGSTQRKFGGTGLGLSISREIAKLLGGELALKSTEGKGSTFTVYLPETREDEQVEEEEVPERLGSSAKDGELVVAEIPEEIPDDRSKVKKKDKPILIIEDDTGFADILLKFTRERGYKGIVAVSGDKGLEYARKYHPLGILLDLRRPVKDGWKVLEELKAGPRTRAIPVHVMSALEARQESLQKGAVDFIHKPLAAESFETIFDKIEAAASPRARNILLIEDNEVHRQALKQYLGNDRWTILTAGTAREGLSVLKKNHIDCIILDMGLPDATGYELMERIRKYKKYEALPIIIYTGASLSPQEEKKIRQYASTIVVKTAESYQRLTDEVSLFLHVVDESKKENVKKTRTPYIVDMALKGKMVLIVDDDVRNIFSLTKVLQNQGMEVLTALNGVEALEKMKENPGVEAVLMDLMMPEMDGYAAIKEIRKNGDWKTLPIITLTALAMKGERDKCIKAGASDYISKPVDPDQLMSLLRVWLFK